MKEATLSNKGFNKLLYEKRLELGLSKKQACKKIHISRILLHLIENGYNPAMGARPMRRLLRKEIEDPLAMLLLSNTEKKDLIVVDCQDDKIEVCLENGQTAGEMILQRERTECVK